MIDKIKRLFLDLMFEFYGILHYWFLDRARECVEEDDQKAFDYWIRKAEKCIDKSCKDNSVFYGCC